MDDLEKLLHLAVTQGASDLHLVVGAPPQLRIDGVLEAVDSAVLTTERARQMCMSRLSAAHCGALEDRLSVDVSFELEPSMRIRAHIYTQRGSLAGSFHLIPQTLPTFEALGLPPTVLEPLLSGLVLVTGHGGSGKSTTLAAIVDKINREEHLHIATLEDPIEYVHAHKKSLLTQQELGTDMLTIHDALPLLFRQNADVFLMGEIRDFSAADLAIGATLTGHKVFATLHAESAPHVIDTMLNMGVEPYQLIGSITCIVAQRLARKVCEDCKEAIQLTREEMRELEVPDEQLDQPIYRGRGDGCSTCDGSGYKGRVAVFEVLTMHTHIKEAILMGYSTAELKNEAIRMGMDTLRMAAVKQMLQGVISPEEVRRHTPPDRPHAPT